MAKNFEKENGRKLLIHGMDIADLIRKDWEEYKREVKERAAAKPPVVVSFQRFPHVNRHLCFYRELTSVLIMLFQRSNSKSEVPSASKRAEPNSVLRERRPVSAEKRKARESVANVASVKKAKSCKSLFPEPFPKKRRSST